MDETIGRTIKCLSFISQGSVWSLRWNAEDERLATCASDGSIKVTFNDVHQNLVYISLLDLHLKDLGDGSTGASRHTPK